MHRTDSALAGSCSPTSRSQKGRQAGMVGQGGQAVAGSDTSHRNRRHSRATELCSPVADGIEPDDPAAQVNLKATEPGPPDRDRLTEDQYHASELLIGAAKAGGGDQPVDVAVVSPPARDGFAASAVCAPAPQLARVPPCAGPRTPHPVPGPRPPPDGRSGRAGRRRAPGAARRLDLQRSGAATRRSCAMSGPARRRSRTRSKLHPPLSGGLRPEGNTHASIPGPCVACKA